MCGILGWISEEEIEPTVVERALETLHRRGPDGHGMWLSSDRRMVLGHRRLAILDPSVRGDEPSIAPDGASAFIHNGEIYNFRELRRGLEGRGERFVSDSDGEVVHRLLRCRGEESLPQIEGMFALALWYERGRRLLLARDRIGIKPLYWAALRNGFAFASEPKAILQLPGVAARVDLDSLQDFLSYGYVPYDRCIFAGIRKLPPAHRLLYDAETRRVEVSPYWKLERREVRDDPEELRARVEEAVRTHMISDVPVGAFLSGGLDSSTVVSRAAGEVAGFPTFTVAYRDGDQSDLEHARIASAAFQTRHHEKLLEIGDLPHALGHAAEVYDEPLYDSSALAVAEVAGLARMHVKTVLTGDGGDEIFGGYGWHETVMRYEQTRRALGPLRAALPAADAVLVHSLAHRPRWARLVGLARLTGPNFIDRYFSVRGFFTAEEQRRLVGRTPEDGAWLFRKFDRPDLPLAHRMLFLDIHTYLPDNGLMKVDRSTMAVGLEARVPLLDRQLAEYAFSLPAERIVRPGATKIAFREAIEPWLPGKILTRSKSGFSPPFKKWVSGEHREPALAILEGGDLAADGLLRPGPLRALVEGSTQRRNNKVWLLLNLEAWYRRWIRGRRMEALSH